MTYSIGERHWLTARQRKRQEADLHIYRHAFEGFTGPLDAVQSGDFQEALRLLEDITAACEEDCCSEATNGCVDDEGVAYSERGETALTFGHIRRARALLVRLQPAVKPHGDSS